MAKQKGIQAVDIVRHTTVGNPSGGSRDVVPGEVLLVPNEISGDDAGYLVAIKKGKPCDPALKAQRAKEAAKEK